MKELKIPGKVSPSGSKKKVPRVTPKIKKKNGGMNWMELSQQLQERVEELERMYSDLKAKGLGERHAVKLRRLEHLHSRLMNMHVCDGCKPALDSLLEDAKWIK